MSILFAESPAQRRGRGAGRALSFRRGAEGVARQGGSGGQGAVVVQDGEVVFGPLFAEHGVINAALALLGASKSPDRFDAFETIGLDRYRCNDDYREPPRFS